MIKNQSEGASSYTRPSAQYQREVSLSYDIFNDLGCTTVVMREDNGKIIFGRNNDTTSFGGEELGKLTVITKHRADGYNEVIHIDYPLFLGIQSGYNRERLVVTEQT